MKSFSAPGWTSVSFGFFSASLPFFIFFSASQWMPAADLTGWGDKVGFPLGGRSSTFTKISARGNHVLRLTSKGTVVAWGANDYGQSTVPAGLSNVVEVVAGVAHSVALKSDGTLLVWGATDNRTNVPPGLSNVVAVSAGDAHTLALKEDGTVVAWGDNSQGQCTIPFGLSNVVAIAAGLRHNLAVKSDGTVVAWGDNHRAEAHTTELQS